MAMALHCHIQTALIIMSILQQMLPLAGRKQTSPFIPTFITSGSQVTNGTNVDVCVLLEDDSTYVPTYDRVAAAVDLALINANSYVLPDAINLRANFMSAGASCGDLQHAVTVNVLRLLRSGVNCEAFVGIGCATSAVGLYGVAEEYNSPIFGCPGTGASSLAINASNNRYPLLLRIPFGLTDMSRSFIGFFQQFNYTHVSFLRDDSLTFSSFTSKYLMNYFSTSQPEIYRNSLELPFSGNGLTLQRMKSLLDEAKNRSRVMLLLTHAKIVRQLMIVADDMKLTGGEFVFLAIELYPLDYWGKIRYKEDDNDDNTARRAFQSLIVFSLSDISANSLDDSLAETIKVMSKKKYNYTYKALEKPDPVALSYYESIMIFAQEIASMDQEGADYRDGFAMVQRIFGTEYDGITGYLRINSVGERDRDMDIKMFVGVTAQFQVTFQFLRVSSNESKTFVSRTDSPWFANNGQMPPNKPQCGFRNDECKNDERLTPGVLATVIVIPILIVLGMAAAAVFAVLKLRSLRNDYNPDWWKISVDNDLLIKMNRTGSATVSKKTLTSQSTAGGTSAMSAFSAYNCDILASYKNALVALTDVGRLEKYPNSDMIVKLNLLKALTNPNLQRFMGIGLTTHGKCQYVVAEVCAKGSLIDILSQTTVKLDWSFKNSLIKDIVFGMTHIHTSPIVSHGNLNGHTCLIDSRFTLKISDYGLPFFRDPAFLQPFRATDNTDQSVEVLLWRAPELLRQQMPPSGTQKGDVYSFAIILQQIILRSDPFELPNEPLEMTEREILAEVIAANIPPVRPRVPRAACSNELYDLMERCWEEIPLERPVFPKIKERLKRVIGDYGDNIVDLLFRRMEQYAMDLELKVAEKTQQFMDEKNRSEQLLSQLLPKSVAAALTRGELVDPEVYESVTIFFSDIVGFTTIAAQGSPMGVVNLLNSLYTFFDSVIDKFDVYKVETIGDAYMVSSGLPVRNGNRHAAEIASMSIELVKGIRSFTVPDRPGQEIKVRIGINSGSCVAGIVGLKMPRYCLFGDTVNVASRMESNGEAMKIHISLETMTLLKNIGGFRTIERGEVPIKVRDQSKPNNTVCICAYTGLCSYI